MMPAPRAVKRLARIALHRFGGLRAILWSSRNSFRILTYHRFSPDFYPNGQAALARQCEFLQRHFRLTPLSEIARSLRNGEPLAPRTLAVTIDDGYRDFLTEAMPVFERWKVPATVYLISDFIDGKLWPWWNRLSFAVMHTRKKLVSIRVGETVEELRLTTGVEREDAVSRITARMVRVRDRLRLEFIESLEAVFEVEIPREAPPEYAALTWDDVRKLADAGVEFGAHTRTHPVLPNVEDADALREEIAGSRARIERELGRPVIHFCYPNGDWNDETERIVAQCGFATAVTTRAELNRRGADCYRLKRLSAEPGLPREYFREEVAGLHAGWGSGGDRPAGAQCPQSARNAAVPDAAPGLCYAGRFGATWLPYARKLS
jgi:peptidoglycan/xylan/chitin deacetylase (PgdA/CDA1 family)